jgi:acetylornithine deacetylase/succinyl-diaminopimelate desuccinylase-like protein
MTNVSLKEYQTWYQHHRKRILEDYFTLLRFPSISTDPAYKKDVNACAHWLKEHLEKIGFNTELWPTKEHPVLFASYEKAGADKPTVLIYNHYDVQPVDPLDLWTNPPFEPILRDGKVYARGASDNKGQLFYVLTAVQAYIELAKTHSFNLKLFIEGEEEVGSKNTREMLESKNEQLKADYCLILDAGIPKQGVPAVTLGLRGITTMNITIRNSNMDLHSGLFGGIVLNPLQALSSALARLWEHGKVAIPHFYDDVIEMGSSEWKEDESVFDKEEQKRFFGIRVFGGEAGCSLLETNWVRPVVEINGLFGGYTGSGFKTVIPAQAHAKVSCRLVPNQTPDKIAHLVANYIRDQLPKGFDCDIEIHPGGLPVRTSSKGHLAQTAKIAYEEVFGRACQFIFCGASVPIVADLERITKGSIVLMGTAMNEDEAHAPNERFSLEQFEQGYLVMGRILSTIGSS